VQPRSIFVLALGLGLACLPVHSQAEPPAGKAKGEPSEADRVPLALAKDRAEQMHGLIADSLEVIHTHYFRREGSVLPARALNDVFAKIEKRSRAKVRWIAVNAPAMSVDNEPRSEFEKKAAEELAAGKEGFARVENGYYYRAGPIPLGIGCVRCHTKFSMAPVKKPLLAGLVIAIPLKEE
jgi:hypothetical protein